ncbi:MAG: TetR/AcrR family transcriptional regulator [Myxococcota bacterium]
MASTTKPPRNPRAPRVNSNAGGPKWRRRKSERPDEILEAAFACFSELGYERTTLDELARRAGVSKPLIYKYFECKEQLFEAVLLSRAKQTYAGLRVPEPNDGVGVDEAIEQFILDVAERIRRLELRALWMVALDEVERFPSVMKVYYDEIIAPIRQGLRALIERGIDEGDFSPEIRAVEPMALVSAAFFAAIWESSLEAGNPVRADAILRGHLLLVLRGLRESA